MSFMRTLTVILLATTLAACSSLHQKETLELGGDPQAWKHHRQQVEPIRSWELQGKLGVRAPQESGSGTLFWLQRNDYYDIRLSGPMGRGATRIQGDDKQTTLEVATPPRHYWSSKLAGVCRSNTCSGGYAAYPHQMRPADCSWTPIAASRG